MRIAIIGAGVAGLVIAKVLIQAGHTSRCSTGHPTSAASGAGRDATRRDDAESEGAVLALGLSDAQDYPEWPNGAQVQAYFAAYATEFGVDRALRLDTEVTAVTPTADGRWTIDTAGAPSSQTFDRVVVANGVFCEPAVPAYPGLDEFTAAGGRLCAGTEFHDAEAARGKHVLVVGYGKSAWIADAVPLPDTTTRRAAVVEQLAFMDVATDTHHCRGAKIIPFSTHHVDEVLGDLGLNIKVRVRASRWLNPIDPAGYRGVTPQILNPLAADRPRPASTTEPEPEPEADAGAGAEPGALDRVVAEGALE